jgi:Fe2+ or Zn2+ uptake regulation protein
VVERLRHIGARYTAARRTVVEALRAAPGPRTVAGLHADLGDTVPLSSLYRTLTVLDDAGVTRRVPADSGPVGYELAEAVAGHHHHLVCTECGRTYDVAADARVEAALDEIAAAVGAVAGLTVTGHRLDLEGRCARCAR